MNHPHDDAIETLLRRQFEGSLPDDGFADRVMRQLPLRRRRIAWPLWTGVIAGAAACWLSLLHTPLLHGVWHDWMNGQLSAPGIVLLTAIAGMALLACWWTLAEADDR